MYQQVPGSPRPIAFMESWYAGKDGANIAQKSNGWAGQNAARWINADYDADFEALGKATTFEEADALLIKMNDLIIDNVVLIPEVNRAADKYGIINTLVGDNVAGSSFEYDYWNIANWNRVAGS